MNQLKLKARVKLDDWLCAYDPYEYDPNEIMQVRKKVLYGKVSGHPRIAEGHGVCTSPIIKWLDDSTVETENTIYELQSPNKGYKCFLFGWNVELALPDRLEDIGNESSRA